MSSASSGVLDETPIDGGANGGDIGLHVGLAYQQCRLVGCHTTHRLLDCRAFRNKLTMLGALKLVGAHSFPARSLACQS